MYWGSQLFLISLISGKFMAQKSIYLEKMYRFDEQQRAQILRSHNRLRAKEPAMNMQTMVWDTRLEKIAYKWARRCDASHRPHNSRIYTGGYKYVGENIWWSNELYLRADLESPIYDFYNEKPFYDFKTTHCLPGQQCGHYTQVVWGSSCSVGCAAAQCGYIKNGRRIKNGHLIICNYGPGGNKYDTRPYLYGPRCAACPSTCTKDGLCPSTCDVPPIKKRTIKKKNHHEKSRSESSATLDFKPSAWQSTWINQLLAFTKATSLSKGSNFSPVINRDAPIGDVIDVRPEGPVAPVLPDPLKAPEVCADIRTECVKWASEGGCVVSTAVSKLCRKTCAACKPSDVFVVSGEVHATLNNAEKDTPNLISDSSKPTYLKEGSCVNLHRLCDFWADFNHCTTNKDYMQLNCFQACNREKCGEKKANLSACQDKASSCDFWASIGECLKNKYFMEWKCPKVCRKCR